MTKLSDTQAVILSAAAQREDRNVLPLPGSLRGGAAAKVVGALLTRGLIAETTTRQPDQGRRRAQPHLAQRRGRAGHPPAHHRRRPRRAIRHRAGGRRQRAHGRRRGAAQSPATCHRGRPAPKAHTPRTGTKQAKLMMLRAEGGATINEIVAATGWQPHTVRGAFAAR